MDILNQFGVQPVLLAAQVVNFLILLFILKKLLYQPILKVLEERKRRIEDSLKMAAEIDRKLAQTAAQAEKILSKALEEGQKIIDDAKEQANQEVTDAKLHAEIVSQKILEEGRAQIQIDRRIMRRELQKEFSSLVISIVQKVTGKMLNQKSQKQLIEKTVKEFRS